jgi:hypothetical protein
MWKQVLQWSQDIVTSLTGDNKNAVWQKRIRVGLKVYDNEGDNVKQTKSLRTSNLECGSTVEFFAG